MLLIADTSVLVNFLNTDRMDLIGKHLPPCVITEHVIAEVTEYYPIQKDRLTQALANGYLELIPVIDDHEVELFGRIQQSGRLGTGESSAIAVALHRGYSLAIDDRRAMKDASSLALERGTSLKILGTRDIVVRLINAGFLSIEQADVLLVSWRTQHRYHLPIRSFSELM